MKTKLSNGQVLEIIRFTDNPFEIQMMYANKFIVDCYWDYPCRVSLLAFTALLLFLSLLSFFVAFIFISCLIISLCIFLYSKFACSIHLILVTQLIFT